jgi:ribosomal protein L37AE/L43A
MATLAALNGNGNGHGPHPIVIKPDGSNLASALSASLAVQQLKKDVNLDAAIARRHLMIEVTKRLMIEGTDYGPIPGSDKPTLLQPGADKLCNLFSLKLEYEVTENVKDWTGKDHGGEPFFYVEVRSFAYRGEEFMGEGIGSCSSWEAKYRWRKAERKCPQCSKENIRKSKQGGWYCWNKTGGCGATFPAGDQTIESQEVGRVRNPDVFDVVNTVQKIALKRAKISATINATSASEFFTQDIEEQPEPEPEPETQKAQQPAQTLTGKPAATLPDAQSQTSSSPQSTTKPWRTFGEMVRCFEALKSQIPWPLYYEVLRQFGVEHSNQFDNAKASWACYQRLEQRVQEHLHKAADPRTFEHYEAVEGDWQ